MKLILFGLAITFFIFVFSVKAFAAVLFLGACAYACLSVNSLARASEATTPSSVPLAEEQSLVVESYDGVHESYVAY